MSRVSATQHVGFSHAHFNEDEQKFVCGSANSTQPVLALISFLQDHLVSVYFHRRLPYQIFTFILTNKQNNNNAQFPAIGLPEGLRQTTHK